MVPLDGANMGSATMLGTVGQAVNLQGGENYVIWQNSKGYTMYDVQRQSDVVIGNTLNDATLLVANGGTVLWLSAQQAATPNTSLTLSTFNWPG